MTLYNPSTVVPGFRDIQSCITLLSLWLCFPIEVNVSKQCTGKAYTGSLIFTAILNASNTFVDPYLFKKQKKKKRKKMDDWLISV